jgi:hypothetical protein
MTTMSFRDKLGLLACMVMSDWAGILPLYVVWVAILMFAVPIIFTCRREHVG